MARPEPDDSRIALEVFADWLALRARGEGVEFDELLIRHPRLAKFLAEFEAIRNALAAAGEPAPDSAAARPASEASASSEPVREHAAREAEDDTRPSPAELLARLAERTAAYRRYRIRGEVARGGMGVILAIWDGDLRRELAMKVILGQAKTASGPAAQPASTSRVTRFLEEAQVTGQLDHPGIVPVHELGVDPDGRLYFTMKLVKGRSLREVFDLVARREAGWTQPRALGILLKVCEAMAYAHDKGVIHRDLKPDNVMVGAFGEVHVMDWGLARILDRQDAKDIRIRAAGPRGAHLQSDREEQRGETPGSPLYTMDGDAIGTPAYMSPEQAAGKVDEVGPHSDVYALGAMLYHLLAGRAPYAARGGNLFDRSILERVQQGPPPSVARVSPRTPAELVAICDKAMAREWTQRYRDMSQLAADLSAYLEHRVVTAHQTGTWAETKKWIERNKSLAASLAAAILILIAGIVVSNKEALRADAKAREAERSAAAEAVARLDADRSAADARAQERIAIQKSNDVLSLSVVQDLPDLIARADRLWPAEPGNVASYTEWLAEAHALTDGRSADPAHGVKARPGLADHRRTLAELEQRALPQTEAERAADLAAHSVDDELSRLRARCGWIARMLGKEPWPSQTDVQAALDQLEPAPADAKAWNELAWPLVRPDSQAHGDEVKALLCARRAVEGAADANRYECRNTLAWALFKLGRFEEALAEVHRVGEEAPEQERGLAEANLQMISGGIARWRTPAGAPHPAREREWSALTREIAKLERYSALRHDWTFADRDDRWWHLQLTRLISSLEEFADPEQGLCSAGESAEHGWGVEKRIEFARTIADRSVASPEASRLWREAIASIGDPAQCPQYAGLVLAPQMGLLPIGRDRDSGLWEFAHLQTGEPATRGADGKLIVTEDTGLVFVLLPGGTSWLGAQKEHPFDRNYDPQADPIETPVHQVTLSPFLLSKYEMTQGQWARISGVNPSAFSPSSAFYGLYDLTHPVERVSWTGCSEMTRWLGLALPSEAQWEYGCRGGTSTPWSTGREREHLLGRVNLADQAALRGGATWPAISDWSELDDGWVFHAPVGALAANPFGLHEMHGNVSEWCLDQYADYSAQPAVDPVTLHGGSEQRICRGGSFYTTAAFARSAARADGVADFRSPDRGLRPARTLTTE